METESTKEQLLIKEIEKGNNEKVFALITDKSLNLELGDNDGLNPLLMAAYKGNYEIVKALIEQGVNVNYDKHNQKFSALMFAAIGGHDKIVNLLLESGADINQVNSVNRTAAQLAGFVNQTNIVILINHFIPKSTIEYYTKEIGSDKKPSLKRFLVNPLHKFVRTVNVHPIYIFLNLENYIDLVENINQVVYVLESICDKELTEKELPVENIAFKFSYLAFVLNYYKKQMDIIKSKDDKLDKIDLIKKTSDLIIKRLLKKRIKNGFPVDLELFLRSALSSFKYKDRAVFVFLLKKLHNVELGDEPNALQLLNEAINEQKGFFNETNNCTTCNELNPLKKCSACKTVWYCNPTCQKYDWSGHKSFCTNK